MVKFLKKFLFHYRDGLPWTLGLCLVSAAVLFLFGIPTLADLAEGGLFKDLRFNYPVYLDLDNKDNLYVIDTNSRRIVSLSAEGRERWSLDGGKRSSGFFESYRLAAIPTGGVCVYNAILDREDSSLEAEEILRFDDAGNFVGTLVRIFYPKTQRGSDDEHLGSLQVKDGFLFYFYQENGKMTLLRRSLDPSAASTDPLTHDKVFSSTVSVDYVSAVPHLPEGILLSDRKGSLFLLKPDGSLSVPAFSVVKKLPVFEKPWDLKIGKDGEVYVLDNYQTAVYKAQGIDALSVQKVFTEKTVLDTGRDRPFIEAIAVGSRGTLGVVDKFNHSVFLLTPEGTLKTITGGPKTESILRFSWVILAVALIFSLSALLAVIGLVRRALRARTSLIIKQITLFLPLVAISVSLGSVQVYNLLDQRYTKILKTKLSLVASLGSRLIDGNLVEKIQKASDFDGLAHRALGLQFDAVLNSNHDDWNRDMRAVIYKYQNDRFYFVKNTSSYYGVMFPYGGASRQHFAAARGGTFDTAIYSDEYGTYLSALAPLRTSTGTIAGVLEIYHNYNTVLELAGDFREKLFQGIILSVATVILLLVAADLILFLALGRLSRASRKLTSGELGITVNFRRHDEIGDLAQDFNTMSKRLREYFDRLAEIRDANARFVPGEFLAFLKKESLADIESGDQVKKRMTILFADIRSFTSLSEGMTPKENFDFINSYLSVMGPVIRECGGFIDRYLGDAIMALFPGSPADGVQAGLRMREVLAEFNRRREAAGQKPIQFGVGLHCEELLLGVIGEASRLSVTVISDSVELVNRLEASTKEHHVGMVLTEPVWKDLPPELKKQAREVGTIEHLEHSLKVYGI